MELKVSLNVVIILSVSGCLSKSVHIRVLVLKVFVCLRVEGCGLNEAVHDSRYNTGARTCVCVCL